jgi:hypothetical protein
LIEFFEDGNCELYNLEEDMGEEQNLASKEPTKTAELKAKLDAWKIQVQAIIPRPNPNYIPPGPLPDPFE